MHRSARARLAAGLAAAVLVVGLGAGCGKFADRAESRDGSPATEQAPDGGAPSEDEVSQLEKVITDTESDLAEAESEAAEE